MSPQFAVDVSLLLSATADPVVQDLLDANKLVRDMRRSSAQSLHFHSFIETPWLQLVFASWADASDRPRPDGSRTGGYVITLATEKLFGHGQEDDISVMACRSCKLPRKIAGSNNGETQALAFADESFWLIQLAWSEMHGVSMRGCHLDETVRQVGGMLMTDSRGIFDALTRSESPQLRLRSSRTGEEARGIKEQCAVSDARIHWVNTSTMLADSLTKTGYPARAVMESFLVKKRWRCTFDPTFESGKRRKARGALYTNDIDVFLPEWSKIEEEFWGMQDMYTRLLSANLDFDTELQHVLCWAPGECRDSRVFHVDCVFLRLC